MRRLGSALRLLQSLLIVSAASVVAADWPMWRYDAQRSACSPEALPGDLELHWIREYSPRVQVWDDPLNNDLMTYDRVFEPIVLGHRLFLTFNDSDQVIALSTRSGRELWRFPTDGPIRLPPVGWNDRVYFTSDDGCLYCVGAEDGRLHWSFRGGPSARKVLGNKRLISAWPARGGPVIRDGVVYFAASIWPFMGTFIYALDAVSGEVSWVNDGTGAQFIKQPHSAPSFAGVAPQGALVATEDVLLVPGGRSVPAAFDRRTGRFLHFEINAGGKGNGGSFVAATEEDFFVHTRKRGVRVFDLESGKKGSFTCNEPVLGGHYLYCAKEQSVAGDTIVAAEERIATARYDLVKAETELRVVENSGNEARIIKGRVRLKSAQQDLDRTAILLAEARDQAGLDALDNVIQCIGRDRQVRWEITADGTGDIIQAGKHLYAAGADAIVRVCVPAPGEAPEVTWSCPVDDRVLRLLAADDRLFAVTRDGRIMAFGEGKKKPVRIARANSELVAHPESTQLVRTLLERSGTGSGYALCYGADDERFLDALLAGSDLHLLVVDPDQALVTRRRTGYERAGLYGSRVAIHAGDPLTFMAPPYFAELVVVSEGLASSLSHRESLKAVYSSVRPYGGTLWVSTGTGERGLRQQVEQAELAQAKFWRGETGFAVVREGPLPGAADWTHLYGDIANTVKSDDRTVRLPLGILWFGGSSNMDVLPRHGHGPSEQVVAGRLFIQGLKSLTARDVYTGRNLWKVDFSDLDTFGVYYDETYTNTPLTTLYNQIHIPGANARGANFVATEDTVYLAVGSECRWFSASTGQFIGAVQTPRREGDPDSPDWGFIGVYEDLLLGGTGFANFSSRYEISGSGQGAPIVDLSASAGLAAFDRRTGKLHWTAAARYGFNHNGIVAGNGRVYCLDRLPKSVEEKLERRGRALPSDYRVVAFDARTGALLWEQTQEVFGTWLSYAEASDTVLQAGARAPDRLDDETGQGMAAYRGIEGTQIWIKKDLDYSGPCILHNDLVITTPSSYRPSSGAFNLRDGRPHTVPNPLTGKLEPWRIYRTYGCNTPVASEHLLTFRSGAAGFYDLESYGGTGNLGGFRSGCSANLIIANGVLNAPDYTRTCSCAYQNQTSLGLVHMPDAEVWTYNLLEEPTEEGERIVRLGLNFSAPGDRRAKTGTLWMDYPSVGGSSLDLPVAIDGDGIQDFRAHSSKVTGEGLTWVAGSGLRNVASIRVGTMLLKAPEEPEVGGSESDMSAEAPRTVKQGTTCSPAPYTVRLHFLEPDDLEPDDRVFSVWLQGRQVLEALDVRRETGGRQRGLIKEFSGVVLEDKLSLRFERTSASKHGSVISGLEMVLEPAAE